MPCRGLCWCAVVGQRSSTAWPGSPWCYSGFGDVGIDSGCWCKAKDIGASLKIMVGSLGFAVGFLWDFYKVV